MARVSDVEIIYYPHMAHSFIKHQDFIDYIQNIEIAEGSYLYMDCDGSTLKIGLYNEDMKGAGYEEEDDDFGARPY